jgi:hypothetical protein
MGKFFCLLWWAARVKVVDVMQSHCGKIST